MKVVSKYQSLRHFKWGCNCDGWDLVDTATLSVKQEKMPAGATEQTHYHKASQQFFFILSGKAQFEIEGTSIELIKGEGLHIEAGKKHKVSNQYTEDL